VETFRFLFRFCRPQLVSYISGLLLVPVSIAANLGIAYLTGEAVAVLRHPASTSETELQRILLWILFAALVRGATLFGMRRLIINASRDTEFLLRNHIFGHLQTQDQLFFKSRRSGDILTRITSDVERSRLIAGPVILYTATTVCMLALALPLMAAINWLLTLLLMVPLTLLTLAVRRIGPRVHERVFEAQEALSDLSSRAEENFSGVRVIKSFTQEDHEIRSFSEVARTYLRESLHAARLSAWMSPIVGGVGDLAVLSILIVGGWFMVQGELDFADFVKFSGYQMQLIWPMIAIGWVVNQFQRGSASVARLRELVGSQPEVLDPQKPRLPENGRIVGAVSIRNLRFSFGRTPILEDVSLEIPLGHTVGIVGRTGAGKSTLANLIPRVYPVPAGAIFIDGVDVNDLPLEALRGAIGFVPQESFLFSRSIEDNIAFGVDDPKDEEIREVAAVTRLDQDIDQFPRGYQEVVGERGVTLSGGQKQRTAIARALLRRPRILILDDALSAVDTQTEEEILARLKPLTKDLTTLIISHRISSIRHADRIYVLDGGRVAEEGTHDSLVKLGGIYAEMDRQQQISDELERF